MYRVIYTFAGEDRSFDVGDPTDDTKVICERIEARLRAEHPTLTGHSLTQHVVDGVLNALADTNTEIVVALPAELTSAPPGNGSNGG